MSPDVEDRLSSIIISGDWAVPLLNGECEGEQILRGLGKKTWMGCELGVNAGAGACRKLGVGDQIMKCGRVSLGAFFGAHSWRTRSDFGFVFILKCQAVQNCSPGSSLYLVASFSIITDDSVLVFAAHQKVHWKEHKKICWERPIW